jgi:thiol-disulfide isomerase/thioredoxin
MALIGGNYQVLLKVGKMKYLIYPLLFFLPFCFLFSCSSEEKEYKPEVGYLAPEFTLETLGGGKMVNLSDYKGKVVLLNFWATWCIPCRKEMPSMEELYKVLKERGFEVLAVNLERFAEEKVSLFVSNYGLTFPILLDKDQKTAVTYQIRAIPTTYIIGKDGVIKEKIVGDKNWTRQELVEKIEGLMGS